MREASIFGGTSIYGGGPLRVPDNLFRLFDLWPGYHGFMYPGLQGTRVKACDI